MGEIVETTRDSLPMPQAGSIEWVRQPAPHKKLRVSVTASCNYSCFFCHNEGVLPEKQGASDLLSPQNYRTVAAAAALAKFTAVKFTGGEPLIYRHGDEDIAAVVATFREAADAEFDLSLTTNGQLLQRFAGRLRASGLRRVTVSVHTLDQELFRKDISAGGGPAAQLRGISAAAAAGMEVKANVLVLRENLAEIPRLADRLRAEGVTRLRLYRLLWSPLLGQRYSSSLVSDNDILGMALGLAGVSTTNESRGQLQNLLKQGIADVSSRSIVIRGHQSVEVDVMPLDAGAWVGEQEGEYAVRLSSRGSLRARLFEVENDVADAIRRGRVARLADEFEMAQRTLM